MHEVLTGFTGKEYAYEYPSDAAVLSLSIYEDMKFMPLHDNKDMINEEIESWIKEEGKTILDSLNAIYKSDTCVIDLESPADTVICQCGHQCVNYKNISTITKCPLCRAPVVTFIKVSDFIAV